MLLGNYSLEKYHISFCFVDNKNVLIFWPELNRKLIPKNILCHVEHWKYLREQDNCMCDEIATWEIEMWDKISFKVAEMEKWELSVTQ